MAPHAEDSPVGISSNGNTKPVNAGEAPMEPGISQDIVPGKMIEFPRPPKFEDKYEEREYQKGRLAAAFRIFGKYGFDEGVAGHITLRDPVQPDHFWVKYVNIMRTRPIPKKLLETVGSAAPSSSGRCSVDC